MAGWAVGTGPATTLRLPAAGVAVHLLRPQVGARRVMALQTAPAELAAHGIAVVELVPSIAAATWEMVEGRAVEVERWVGHDGRMNTWGRLRSGAALLARVHDAWATLGLGCEGEACDLANWISPTDTMTSCVQAARRLSQWGLGDLAADVVRLAELISDSATLPAQVVHGDFWDDTAGLTVSLTTAELAALPYALARQPLWTLGRWLLTEPDEDRARTDALDAAAAVSRALDVMTRPDRLAEAFSGAASTARTRQDPVTRCDPGPR